MNTPFTPGHENAMKRMATALRGGQIAAVAGPPADPTDPVPQTFHPGPTDVKKEKEPLTNKIRYKRKINRHLKDIRDCVNHGEYDTAHVHAHSLSRLFNVLKNNPDRAARKKK